MNICFLTSGHDPFDDRIFYNMAASLKRLDQCITIISSTTFIQKKTEGIELNCFDGNKLPKKKKINLFREHLSEYDPDIVICSEPLPLLAAIRYRNISSKKVKIIYDVTEWYPSGKNLRCYNNLLKSLHFIRLLTFNYFVSIKTDGFIFGEYYKSLPYRFLFPWKPFVYISYYPDLKYIPCPAPIHPSGKINLSYSGKISHEKGWNNFKKIIETLNKRKADLEISVRVIGWDDPDSREPIEPINTDSKKVSVKHYDRMPLYEYLETISSCDVFLDLREITTENNHCLPVKLFYYASLGRPVIFSNLKAIRKDADISRFGYLVNPHSSEEIVNLIIKYIENHDLYLTHCKNAKRSVTATYNWGSIEKAFTDFVTSS